MKGVGIAHLLRCRLLTPDSLVNRKMNAAMRLQAHSGNSALQAQSKSPAQPVVLIVLSRGPIRENKKTDSIQSLFCER